VFHSSPFLPQDVECQPAEPGGQEDGAASAGGEHPDPQDRPADEAVPAGGPILLLDPAEGTSPLQGWHPGRATGAIGSTS